MKNLNLILDMPWCQVALSGLLCGLFAPRTAMAQPAETGSQEAWVVSYALVILCVGLGLFIVSRPSRRDKRVRKK